MSYHCVAVSTAGFVQQLAVGYLARGYLFYVIGVIPRHKDPDGVDTKLIEKYGIEMSKWTRARKKKRGEASVQYLRFGDTFVLVATEGQHGIFEEERVSIRDFRQTPLRFGDYSIGYGRGQGGWHASVRIAREVYQQLERHFMSTCLRNSATELASEFHELPFEPYAPIKRQLLRLFWKVNARRSVARLEPVHLSIRLNRKPRRVFSDAPD